MSLSYPAFKAFKFTACLLDIRLYFTPLGQARQFIKICGNNILTVQYKQISNKQAVRLYLETITTLWLTSSLSNVIFSDTTPRRVPYPPYPV
jgi:hypothetical protein